MKKLVFALSLLTSFSLLSQERKDIEKDKQCSIVTTWTTKDGNNQMFYYTKLNVTGDSKYPVYQLRVVKYVTDNVRHPLKDRIIQVILYPDHPDNKFVNFFSCSTNSGEIERKENKYLYCYNGDKLLIIEQVNDSTFIPNTLVKEGQYDNLVERYHFNLGKSKKK